MTDNLLTRALRQVLALPDANVLSVVSVTKDKVDIEFMAESTTYYATYSEKELALSIEDEGFDVIVAEPPTHNAHLVTALGRLATSLEERANSLTALAKPTKVVWEAGAEVFGR